MRRLLLSLTDGMALAFDESKHPRGEAGTSQGGEFVSKDGGVAHEKSVQSLMGGGKDQIVVRGVDGRKITLVRYRRPGRLPLYKIRHSDGSEESLSGPDHMINYLEE